MARLRFIGDVHEVYPQYLKLANVADFSLQVGDVGFDYEPLAELDPIRHRALAGNHDNYEKDSPHYFRKVPHFLGDFGVHEVPGFPAIFYVRGAWSIDGDVRRERQGRLGSEPTWWEEEELDEAALEEAISAYRHHRPELVVTHEAPLDVVGALHESGGGRLIARVIPTRTNQALQAMLDAYRPKLWIFGHYHVRWERELGGTRFIGLDMLRGTRSRGRDCFFDLVG